MSFPAPDITDINRPYWEGLQNGKLLFHRCTNCGAARLPPRAACPTCLSPDAEWQRAKGHGKVISWVVYHHAYADHLKAQIPYDVTIVELHEGPRLLTNVVNSEAGNALRVGQLVRLKIEQVEGTALARFEIPDQEDAR